MKMCNVHKHRPAIEGKQTCKDCRERVKARRGKFRVLGLCFCGQFPEAGFTQCADCRLRAKKKDERHKASGNCNCGRPRLPKRNHCSVCLQREKDKIAARLEQGLCYCGNRPPKENYKQCQECLDKKNARSHTLKAAGRCPLCAQIVTGSGRTLCSNCRNKASKRMRELFNNDAQFTATVRLRNCVYTALKRKWKASKDGRTELLLGCNYEFARKHIERLWKPGMSWANSKAWHIDHYVPCAFFDLTIPRQQKLCNNWRNLRPVWRWENLSKKNRLPLDYKERLAELEDAVPSDMNDPMFQ